jgi:leader peptidase (prepilin peptidase)/N-methyltransferase
MLFVGVVLAVLGSILGSFLNVLILRKGVSALSGRSHCPSCGKNIAAYDLIPIFSWFILRGKCRNCGSRISIQYPIVEFTTATLFCIIGLASYPVFLFSIHDFLILLAHLAIVVLLIAITVYDIRHTIIPDEWSYGFAALALLLAISSHGLTVGLLAGPIAAVPLFFLWAVSQGRWMGLGDPKLALGIGWLLGFPLGVVAVFVSFILGTTVLLPMLFYERVVTHNRGGHEEQVGLTMKTEVPFGPFLIASCLIFWALELYGVNVPLYLLGL